MKRPRDILQAIRADHINCHPHTLHIWRPQGAEIPTRPKEFV